MLEWIKNAAQSPPRLLFLIFAVMVCIGTVLLALPQAAADGQSIGLLDALFTAVSAVCVNGLAVVDTGTAFSSFGQVVIMLLIQAGGLGFMTLGATVAVILGKKIGLRQRLMLQQSTHSFTAQGLVKLSLAIVAISFLFEAVATAILTWRWQDELGFGKALYYAVFHAVSAFNNAGFTLWTDSLTAHAGDPVVNLVIISLFVAGGLGFIVIMDIFRKRSWRLLSMHSKVVLLASGVLSLIGVGLVWLLESFNPQTLGGMPGDERALAALFQGLTPRSAGFHTVDIGGMLTASQFVLIILMFIGASSGGTGGGIKTNTLVVLILATLNTFRGGGQIHAFERRITQDTVARALAVTMSSLAVVMLVALLLTVTEGIYEEHFLLVLFETTSAFSTTGLSMGLTAELTPLGKVIISFTMFIGRLGPLALAYALSQKKPKSKIGYAEDHILIG